MSFKFIGFSISKTAHVRVSYFTPYNIDLLITKPFYLKCCWCNNNWPQDCTHWCNNKWPQDCTHWCNNKWPQDCTHWCNNKWPQDCTHWCNNNWPQDCTHWCNNNWPQDCTHWCNNNAVNLSLNIPCPNHGLSVCCPVLGLL
jgi:hypothetical protein